MQTQFLSILCFPSYTQARLCHKSITHVSP